MREIPDIENPELRHVNALLSAFCFDEAQRRLTAYETAHPDAYKAAYVHARGLWMRNHEEEASALIGRTVATYPDFASAYVLMAGLAIESQDYEVAASMLDIAEPISPTDLWIFADRIRVAVHTTPNANTADRVVRVMDGRQFPRGMRSEMADIVLGIQGYGFVDAQTIDRAFRTDIELGIQPYPNKVVNYAQWLIERQQRTAEAREWLQPLLSMRLKRTEGVHLLIAESWLFDAARIDPVQTSRNFDLIEKARNELGGNIDMLARTAALNPAFKPLQGFFKIVENVDKPNTHGETALCTGLQAIVLDVSMVKDLLENLADPNQNCTGIATTPLGLVVTRGGTQTAEQIEILKDLLLRGADPNPKVFEVLDAKEFCRTDPRCKPFLPLLQPAWAAAAPTP